MFQHILSLLGEFKAYNRFFSKDFAPCRQLVFFSESAIYYQTFEPFIIELLKNPSIQFSYLTNDPKDPILTHHHERLHPFYFDLCLKSVMDRIDARCFVWTAPDLNSTQVRAFRKSKKVKTYLYLFHAFSSTHLQYNETAFDAYDAIFCVGPHHTEEIKKREQVYALPAKQLLPVGYPRIDVVYQKFQHYTPKFPDQTTVLVAPTWGPGNLMEQGIDSLIDTLKSTDYRVVVRPHPEFLKRCPDRAQQIKQKVQALPHFVWEDHLLTEDNVYEAAVCITDRSGIAFEYAFGTERPVIFIETPPKEFNPNWRALELEPIELQLRRSIGIPITLHAIPQLVPILQDLINHADDWKQTLQSLRQRHVYHPNQSAHAGADYILSQLQ